MKRITITLVNYYSASLIRELLENLRVKTGSPDCVKLLIIDNTNGEDGELSSLRENPFPTQIHPVDPGGISGSRAHAFGLNCAMGLLDTEFTLVVDPDIHIFMNGWDEFCVSQLASSGKVAVGAPYPPWKIGRYHDFPSPPFCFFRTRPLQIAGADWTPFGRSRAEDLATFLVRQVGRLGGFLNRRRYEKHGWVRSISGKMERALGVFSKDTGWRIAENARKSGWESVIFDTVIPGRIGDVPSDIRQPLGKIASQFEVYSHQKDLVLAHKYGTGGFPWITPHGGDHRYWRESIANLEKSLSPLRTRHSG